MKTVLITGCSSGFGKITAEQLADNGYRVFAGVRNTETSNKEVADELSKNSNIEVVNLDITSSESIAKVVAKLQGETIDVLVNNAGVAGTGFAEMHDVEKVKQIFQTNVFGLYELTNRLLPTFRKQKSGLIVSVTSVVGRMVMPMWGAYSASKFAVEAFAETWRYELMPLGIDSVLVEPGPHPTTGIGMKMEPFTAPMPEMDVFQQYGPVADAIQSFGEQMKISLENGTFQKPEGVANAIVQLIETPYGQRPMRTVVDEQLAPVLEGLNDYTDQMYRQMYAPS